MTSDPGLLEASRKQLRIVLASGDPLAFLGWREAWNAQAGIDPDDLTDVMKAELERKGDPDDTTSA